MKAGACRNDAMGVCDWPLGAAIERAARGVVKWTGIVIAGFQLGVWMAR
jgi:hypothetical protein